MRHKFEGSTLVIEIDDEEQKKLAELKTDEGSYWFSDDVMYDVLEPLTCNSELEWLSSDDTGDMTSAPILGVLGDEQREKSGPYGATWCGSDEKGPVYQPILNRWAFADYERTSPQEMLLNEGKAVFYSRWG